MQYSTPPFNNGALFSSESPRAIAVEEKKPPLAMVAAASQATNLCDSLAILPFNLMQFTETF
jgi:hypothetical protein